MKVIPKEIDEYFVADSFMMWAMINYNMPLATIYAVMVLLGTIMYYVAVDSKVFQPIPWKKSTEKYSSGLFKGLLFGVGFLFLYNMITSAMTGVAFSATALGDSAFLGMVVFGIMVPISESRYFFRTAMQWVAYKARTSTRNSLLSFDSIFLMILMGAVFTIFHLTAKGIENNAELMLTFAFGAASVGMIIYFQQIMEAVIMHIIVNSKGVGLVDYVIDGVKSGVLFTNAWFMGTLAVIGLYGWKAGWFKNVRKVFG